MNSIKIFNDSFGVIVMIITLGLYFFVQPIAFIHYLISLSHIHNSSGYRRKMYMIIANKNLWWYSLGPCIALFLAIILTDIFLQFNSEENIFAIIFAIPFLATWIYVSLFCIIGFLIKLFYKQENKFIPMKWYRLGLRWYGVNFAFNILILLPFILII